MAKGNPTAARMRQLKNFEKHAARDIGRLQEENLKLRARVRELESACEAAYEAGFEEGTESLDVEGYSHGSPDFKGYMAAARLA